MEINLDTDMYFQRPPLEPATAAGNEILWFGYFRNTKSPLVEAPGLLLAARRHGELNVIQTRDWHADLISSTYRHG
jgi:hypothetical protein